MKYDLKNQRFGRLFVNKFVGISPNRHTIWEVQCDCGTIKTILGYKLVYGHTKSCGCYRKDFPKLTKTLWTKEEKCLRSIWRAMKHRCLNPNNKHYKDYGGRGIIVCERWLDFNNFLVDVFPRPPKFSLERINNNENYCPENVRWASMKDQQNNRRNNRKITLKEITKTLTEWSRETGLSIHVIFYRLKRGWSIERTLTEPLKR